MNSLTRIMSFDKTKVNQKCDCVDCVSVENAESNNRITEYPKLSEEEIEQIISERYFNKDEKTKTFIRKALKVHGDRYDYFNVNYVNAHTKIEIICRIEGHEPFLITPNNHLSNHGCPSCGGNKKLTNSIFIERANKVHGVGTYDYSKVNYINNYTEVVIICHNHETPYEFKQQPNNHLQGQGCPKCNNYKGEIEIRNFLIENKIEFEEQKRFDDCRNILPLPFDFYIPKYNLCIEYDGIQHFQNTNWYGKLTETEMIENFQGYQFRDNIKNEYCEKNGINLLRLNNLNTICEELIKYFQKL